MASGAGGGDSGGAGGGHGGRDGGVGGVSSALHDELAYLLMEGLLVSPQFSCFFRCGEGGGGRVVPDGVREFRAGAGGPNM